MSVVSNHPHNSRHNFNRDISSLKRQFPYLGGQSHSSLLLSSPFSSANSHTTSRSSSGDCLNGLVHRRPCTSAYHASVMVNRSGKETVKEYLASINDLCDEQEKRCTSSSPSVPPPIEKCTALLYWSTDAYYAIVISKNGGIATVLRVMRVYLEVNDSDVEDFCERGRRAHKVHSNASRFQVCCARILMGLCQVSPRLRQSVLEAGGREILLAAIKKYPRSFDTSSMDILLKDTDTTSAAADTKEHDMTTSTTSNDSPTVKKDMKLLSAKQRLRESKNHLVVVDDQIKAMSVVSYF
jgi:hypothetical protein